MLSQSEINQFNKDGAVLIKGKFEKLRNGINEDHKIEPETLYIIRLSRRYTPKKVRVMIDFLKDALKKN